MADLETIRCAVFATVVSKLRHLSPEVSASLLETSKQLERTIPVSHQNDLIAAGLARHALGGFMLTDLGTTAATVLRDSAGSI
jgi:hypothetical protein